MSGLGFITACLSSSKNRRLKYSHFPFAKLPSDLSHMFHLGKREQRASSMDSVWMSLGILLSPASLPFSLFNLTLHNIIDGPKKKKKDDLTFWWISPIPFFMFESLSTLLADSWSSLGSKAAFSIVIIPKTYKNPAVDYKQLQNHNIECVQNPGAVAFSVFGLQTRKRAAVVHQSLPGIPAAWLLFIWSDFCFPL